MTDVRIVEVGPRDGLQNLKQVIDIEVKKTLIQDLRSAGLREIEAGAFVSPKWVPQMADSETLIKSIEFNDGLSALVPNARGLYAFKNTDLQRISFFTAVSNSFNKNNINMSFEESIGAISSLLQQVAGLFRRVYLSTVFFCPHEGEIDLNRLKEVFESLSTLNFEDLSLGDTIGRATPSHVKKVLNLAKDFFPLEKISMHFHDTYGTALANCQASLEFGIRSFDSSCSGLGGCPYAPGASGNVGTEDLVYLLQQEGFTSGVDLFKLVQASSKVDRYLNRESQSKVHRAILSNRALGN
tara:strand:- start:382 stop:1275 length:894 start_codon:yes stop_codon:yes gene_type:complete